MARSHASPVCCPCQSHASQPFSSLHDVSSRLGSALLALPLAHSHARHDLTSPCLRFSFLFLQDRRRVQGRDGPHRRRRPRERPPPRFRGHHAPVTPRDRRPSAARATRNRHFSHQAHPAGRPLDRGSTLPELFLFFDSRMRCLFLSRAYLCVCNLRPLGGGGLRSRVAQGSLYHRRACVCVCMPCTRVFTCTRCDNASAWCDIRKGDGRLPLLVVLRHVPSLAVLVRRVRSGRDRSLI